MFGHPKSGLRHAGWPMDGSDVECEVPRHDPWDCRIYAYIDPPGTTPTDRQSHGVLGVGISTSDVEL